MKTATVQPLRLDTTFSSGRVIVVGGGLAGLFAALKLAPMPVTVLSPRALGLGASSAWAQGGIAAAIGEGDTPEAHAADTIAAGAGLTDPAIASIVASEAASRIDDLLTYGVPFDRDLDGKLRLSREAAHSARRIVRVNGDQAGRAVMASVIAAACSTPSISVLENVQAVELVKEDGKIVGVYATRTGGQNRASFLAARAVVLATGGIGQLFRVTTNPAEAFGSGLAMAARAGAIIADAEFVQFHPTAFDVARDPAPLASEALRGDGATLVNSSGARFMLGVHPDAELAPRDIVARAVHREIASGRGAFLDCRLLDLEGGFPAAAEVCRQAGLDPLRQPIPVAPAAHYHMGGVYTDARGRTSLSGLWAAGEVACTGVHGANRLASNSLLEAIVFAARAAEDIASEASQWYALGTPSATGEAADRPIAASNIAKKIRQSLRDLMSRQVGVERSGPMLEDALTSLAAWEAEARDFETASMVTAALFVTAAAWQRKESRGGHMRLDFPHLSGEPPRHSFIDLKAMREIVAQAVPAATSPAAKPSASRKAV